MIDKLISSLLTFFLALVPIVSKPLDSVNNQVTIIFTGDVMLGRSVMGASLDNNDSFYAFRHIRDVIENADITFSNMENAIIENCPRQGKGSFSFCTTPEIAKGLNFAGIDVVTLANNHSGNYGKKGLEETKKYLDDLGIKWVDGSNCVVIEKNETKFGFVGFNFIYKEFSKEDLELIKNCKQQSDTLVVGPHWGEEYKSIANNKQLAVAHAMIDSGADVIIGHHPHWVQNYEEIDGKPVYYSLGNFIFDQMWSEETKKGLIVKMTFQGKELVNREEFKTYIRNLGQAEILQ